jgi:hypothetical protein
MCYEYEDVLRRAEEARKQEEDRKRKEQGAPGKPSGDKAPRQPDPVPA